MEEITGFRLIGDDNLSKPEVAALPGPWLSDCDRQLAITAIGGDSDAQSASWPLCCFRSFLLFAETNKDECMFGIFLKNNELD